MVTKSMEAAKGKICRLCNGKGKVSKNKGEAKQTCPQCRGTGTAGYPTK